MTTDELIVMGKIGAVHGVRGEVKIHSFTDPTENLFDYPVWHLRRDGVTKQVKLASARSQGKGLVAKIEGLDDREIARTIPASRFVCHAVSCLSWKRASITGISLWVFR